MIDVRKGIGMTSARTRDRLVQRLRANGIKSEDVLERIRNVPRHLFVDEALSSRAYEDTALPIGLGQTSNAPAFPKLQTSPSGMVRPRVASDIVELVERETLHQCIRPLEWSLISLRAIMDIRAHPRLTSGQTSMSHH